MNKKILFLSLFLIFSGLVLMSSYANAVCNFDAYTPGSCYNETDTKLNSISLSPLEISDTSTSTLTITVGGIKGYIYDCTVPYSCFVEAKNDNVNIKIVNNYNGRKNILPWPDSLNDDGIRIKTADLSDKSYWTNGIYRVTAYIGDEGNPTSFITKNFTINRTVSSGGDVNTTLSTNKVSLYTGDTLVLTWGSTGANSCSSNFSTSNSTSGTTNIQSITSGSHTYTVTCSNSLGSNDSASVTVNAKDHTTDLNISQYLNVTPKTVARRSIPIDVSWGINSPSPIPDDFSCALDILGNKNDTHRISMNEGHTQISSEFTDQGADNQGDIFFDYHCFGDGFATTTHATTTVTVKHNYVHWKAKLKNSCSDADSSASQIPEDYEHNNIRLDGYILKTTDNPDWRYLYTFTDAQPDDGDDRVWGALPMSYGVLTSDNPSYGGDSDPYDISGNYSYCNNSGEVEINNTSGGQEKEIDIYFEPTPTVSDAPTNLGGYGECRQTVDNDGNDDVKTQAFIHWSPVSGASYYNIYNNNVFVGRTDNNGALYIYRNFDTTQPVYNEQLNLTVKAVDSNGAESDASDSLTITMPSSCTGYPDPSGPSFDIVPSSAIIKSDTCSGGPETVNFKSLYDPDGSNDRYGHFDITSYATWGIDDSSIATNNLDGSYTAGSVTNSNTTNVTSSYTIQPYNLTASASLTVADCGQGSSQISLEAVGECRQNAPVNNVQPETQIHLSWSSVPNTALYDIYRDGQSIGVSDTNGYNDIFSPIKYNEQHSYNIVAKDEGGNVLGNSNEASATTPTTTGSQSCTTPPDTINVISPTLITIPSDKDIYVNAYAQFNALYDPDGTSDRYGEFDVTGTSNWGSNYPNIATLTGTNGLFKGIDSGDTPVFANYSIPSNSIEAFSGLHVTNVSDSDFSVTINPSYKEVNITTGASSATYLVTVTSINGFNGLVKLIVPSFSNQMSGSFDDSSTLNFSDASSITRSLTINVPSDTYSGRVTFDVYANEYIPYSADVELISHYVSADINVVNNNIPDVTAELTPHYYTINPGDHIDLHWTTTGATNCDIDQGVGVVLDNQTPIDGSGSVTVSPDRTTTYTLTCSNSNGNTTDISNIGVNWTPPNDYPYVTMNAAPYVLEPSSSSTLMWMVYSNDSPDYQTNECSITSDGPGSDLGIVCDSVSSCSEGGENIVYPTASQTIYTIACNVSDGGTIDSHSYVYVNGGGGTDNLSATLTADPTSLSLGDSSILSWSTTNASKCFINNDLNNDINTVLDQTTAINSSGSFSVFPGATVTYTLTCQNGNDEATDNANVTVSGGGGGDLSCSVDPSHAISSTAPTTVDFTINASGGTSPYSYKFDTGDKILNPTSNSFSYTYNNSGAYSPVATVTDNSGAVDTCDGPFITLTSSSNCKITASPSSILSGQSSLLSWSCLDPDVIDSCYLDSNSVNKDGSERVRPQNTTTYTLTCNKNDGSQSIDSAKVSVGFLPILREIIPRW